ncbi:hypothetical protein L9F63_020310, partial [Diploptera punctata]
NMEVVEEKMAMDVQTTCFLTYGEERTESSRSLDHQKRLGLLLLQQIRNPL